MAIFRSLELCLFEHVFSWLNSPPLGSPLAVTAVSSVSRSLTTGHNVGRGGIVGQVGEGIVDETDSSLTEYCLKPKPAWI